MPLIASWGGFTESSIAFFRATILNTTRTRERTRRQERTLILLDPIEQFGGV